jgi:hypothetical protein
MDKLTTETMPTTKHQPIESTQKRTFPTLTKAELEERLVRNEEKLAQFGVIIPEKKSTALMTNEERNKELVRIKEELAKLKKEALPGKSPIRFSELDNEKIDFETPILRESYESSKDVLKSLTAATDSEIALEIFSRGLNALPGKNVARNANIAAQALADVSPQDITEARFCMQEMALYTQGMAYLYRAENCNMLNQCDFYMKNAIKLLRLHNETIEARSKYKRNGEQRVVVQHIQVNDGGKAIVGGNLEMSGVGGNKK